MFEALIKALRQDLTTCLAHIASLYGTYYKEKKSKSFIRGRCLLYAYIENCIAQLESIPCTTLDEVHTLSMHCRRWAAQLISEQQTYTERWGIEDFHIIHRVKRVDAAKDATSETEHTQGGGAATHPALEGTDTTYQDIFKTFREKPAESIAESKRQMVALIIDKVQTTHRRLQQLYAHQTCSDFEQGLPYYIRFDEAQLKQYTLDLIMGGHWHSIGMAPAGQQKTSVKNRYACTQSLDDCYFQPVYDDTCINALRDFARGDFFSGLFCSFGLESEQLSALLTCYIDNAKCRHVVLAACGQLAMSSLSPAHSLVVLRDGALDERLQLLNPTRWQQHIEILHGTQSESIVLENRIQWHFLFTESLSAGYVVDSANRQLRNVSLRDAAQFKKRSYVNHIALSDAARRAHTDCITELIELSRKTGDQAARAAERIVVLKQMLREQSFAISEQQHANEIAVMAKLQHHYHCIPALELKTVLRITPHPQGVLLRATEVELYCHSPQIVYPLPQQHVKNPLFLWPWLKDCKAPVARMVKAELKDDLRRREMVTSPTVNNAAGVASTASTTTTAPTMITTTTQPTPTSLHVASPS